MVKDDVGHAVSVAAPVAAPVTSSHASVPVSAGCPSSSVSLSCASNSLSSADRAFSFLGDPSGWSAIERDPGCEYVSFGSESFEVLFSRHSKLRFLRDGSWLSRADGSAMVLVHVSSGKALFLMHDKGGREIYWGWGQGGLASPLCCLGCHAGVSAQRRPGMVTG